MKKLPTIMSILGLFIASSVGAADVVITITIPDAYVARVVAAIEGEMKCPDSMNARDCYLQHISNDLKALVRQHERKVNQESFDSTYQEPAIQ